jgi:hypothetical protein
VHQLVNKRLWCSEQLLRCKVSLSRWIVMWYKVNFIHSWIIMIQHCDGFGKKSEHVAGNADKKGIWEPALLGYHAASSGNFYRRFATLDSWPLKIGQIGCPETSLRNYDYSLRNNSEERSSRLCGGGSLKSRNRYLFTSKFVPTAWGVLVEERQSG